jgi:branched-chain amino acid transport system substrate-binding protein
MHMRLLCVVMALILVIGGFFFFFQRYEAQPPVNHSPRVVRIAWLGPLYGEASFLCVDALKAIRLALEQYNNRRTADLPKVELIVANDDYNPVLTKRAYQSIMKTQAPLAIFISNYQGVLQVGNLARHQPVLIIDPLDNDDVLSKVSENVFLLAKKLEVSAATLANALIAQGHKKIMIIHYADDCYLRRMANTVKSIFENSGGQADLIRYNDKTKNFNAMIARGQRQATDAYLFFGYKGMDLFLKEIKQHGITTPLYVNNTATILKETTPLQFLYFTSKDGNVDRAKIFLHAFQQKYGQLPTIEWNALQSYDAMNILLLAIQQASLDKNTWETYFNSVKNNLFSISNYKGVSGDISIQLNGASRGIYFKLYRMENGKLSRVFMGTYPVKRCHNKKRLKLP